MILLPLMRLQSETTALALSLAPLSQSETCPVVL